MSAPETAGQVAGIPGDAVGEPILDIAGLTVSFAGVGTVLDDVDLRLAAGRCLAIVGESGAGKSVLARSVVGLAGEGGAPATVSAATFAVAGHDVRRASQRRWRRLRGAQVGFVLQDALQSLDPLRTVGAEVGESLRLRGVGAAERRRRVHEALALAGLDDPQTRAAQRSGELSGGMRQRALIASAIVSDPPLLVADEPTTALDATVARGVLDLLARMRDSGRAVLLVSHDLAAVARLADDVVVLDGGRVVERGPVDEVLRRPRHEVTRALLDAVPSGPRRASSAVIGAEGTVSTAQVGTATATEAAAASATGVGTATAAEAGMASAAGAGTASAAGTSTARAAGAGTTPAAGDDGPPGSSGLILHATGLRHGYRLPSGGSMTALDSVDLTLKRGKSLGVVGESGSGKSTLARVLVAAEQPDAGQVALDGGPWTEVSERQRRPRRHLVRMVPQDPLGSFDPRWTVARILQSALRIAGSTRTPAELLAAVHLPEAFLHRRPRSMSGGQRQRLAIARALAAEPAVLVLDEPVSALDATVQAAILDLLVELQERTGTALVLISHDLAVVRAVCESVAVMHQGRIVESGPVEEVWARPSHWVTRALLEASTP